MILFHLFRALPQWVNEMTDPRNTSYITYTRADLVLMAFLKNVRSLKTMRSMEKNFNEETSIETLKSIVKTALCRRKKMRMEPKPGIITTKYWKQNW